MAKILGVVVTEEQRAAIVAQCDAGDGFEVTSDSPWVAAAIEAGVPVAAFFASIGAPDAVVVSSTAEGDRRVRLVCVDGTSVVVTFPWSATFSPHVVAHGPVSAC
jgi:hypothetical protein